MWEIRGAGVGDQGRGDEGLREDGEKMEIRRYMITRSRGGNEPEVVGDKIRYNNEGLRCER